MDVKLPTDTVIKRDEKNETIIFVKGKNLSEELENDKKFHALQSTNQYSEIALAFLTANHLLFQLIAPSDELSVKSVESDDLGFTHIKFQQSYKGISVCPAEINLHLNQQNHVYLIQGRYIPTPENVTIQPVITEKDAMGIVAEKLGKDAAECSECRSELVIYADTNILPCLAYRIEANPNLTEGWEFIIDANSGAVLKKLPTVFNEKSPMGQMKHMLKG
jgi:bacillolysin